MSADRHAAAVESAAYAVVAAGVADAARRAAHEVMVTARRDGDTLVVEVTDDGAGGRRGVIGLADRAGALGGRVEQAAGRLRAELPCA